MKRKYSQKEVEQRMSGHIYINSDDLNIFVRKKGLYSCTINLGNEWSWIIMCAELLVIVIILLFVL